MDVSCATTASQLRLLAEHCADGSAPFDETELAALRAAYAQFLAASYAQKSRLLSLPGELLVRVLQNADATSLARADCCCRALHSIMPQVEAAASEA